MKKLFLFALVIIAAACSDQLEQRKNVGHFNDPTLGPSPTLTEQQTRDFKSSRLMTFCPDPNYWFPTWVTSSNQYSWTPNFIYWYRIGFDPYYDQPLSASGVAGDFYLTVKITNMGNVTAKFGVGNDVNTPPTMVSVAAGASTTFQKLIKMQPCGELPVTRYGRLWIQKTHCQTNPALSTIISARYELTAATPTNLGHTVSNQPAGYDATYIINPGECTVP